jgi:2-polyprenyl-6-methoxyphenol hydroxylase-like FAD-dependent oxidoreductase
MPGAAYTVHMNILISGASIAGPALAFWLRRHGFTVTVVERAPALRPGGYAVDVRGPALDVLARMGLREVVRPLETDTLSNAVVDARGRRFGRMDRGFGVLDPGDVEVLRGDLSRAIYDATREGVEYRFGDSVASLRDRYGRVAVTFEGGERAEYDLVIGADGVHSRTRALAFGDEAALVRDLGCCMAIFTAPNHLGLDREQLLFNGVGRIASVKSANGNGDLKVCVFFTAPPGTFPTRDVDAQRQLVADAFAGAGWEFPRFMEAMWKADDFYADVTCQVHMDSYHAGRVALVGDAAYCPSPMSGQGTSLALVGAYVLASALGEASASGDVEAALARYDESMRDFVRQNQQIAEKLASTFAPRTTFQVWSRNAAMRLLPYVPAASAVMKLAMRSVRQASQAMTLPVAREPTHVL